MSLKTVISNLGVSDLLDFVYPPICLCCDSFADDPDKLICNTCWNKIELFDYPVCNSCYEMLETSVKCPTCSPGTAYPVFALGHYVDPLKEIIHQFKYHGFRKLGVKLARRLMDKHRDRLRSIEVDCIVPVPLHSYRQKSRGFNQAAVLADIIGLHLKLPVIYNSLVKIKRTSDQAKLDPQGRLKNIKGAFKIVDDELKNKKVLIVDDVVTTGATVQEILSLLLDSEAKPVAICSVAMAGL